MQIIIYEYNDSKIAEIHSDEILISDVQDALDLILR